MDFTLRVKCLISEILVINGYYWNVICIVHLLNLYIMTLIVISLTSLPYFYYTYYEVVFNFQCHLYDYILPDM